MFDFRYFNRQTLAAFIASSAYHHLDILPISRQRALSHIRNPRAQDNDILLVVAYQNDELVGYLGLLPDFLYDNNGNTHRFAWLSTIWLHEKMRGKGLGGKIVLQGAAAWSGQCLATEFVPAIRKMYDKTGIFTPKTIDLEGIRLYINSNSAYILPPKKPIFQKLKPLLSGIDKVINTFLGLRFGYKKGLDLPFDIEYVQEIDAETDIFIQQLQKKQVYRRTATEINWLLQNPWILESPTDDSTSKRYNFSSLDRSFGYYALKIRDKNHELVGFMILQKRNKILKIPFLYYQNIEISDIAAIINEHLLQWRIDMFTTFQADLVAHYTQYKGLALWTKPVKRSFLIAHDLYALVTEQPYLIQDGDGDCGFT